MKIPENKNVLVLLSGGIDSSSCIHYYKQQGFQVHALFVNFGQKDSSQESVAAHAVSKYYHIQLQTIEINSSDIPTGYIPGRNLLLLSIGLMTFQFDKGLISLGIHSGTDYSDCSPKFEKLMQDVFIMYEEGRIRLDTPFLNWAKSELID